MCFTHTLRAPASASPASARLRSQRPSDARPKLDVAPKPRGGQSRSLLNRVVRFGDPAWFWHAAPPLVSDPRPPTAVARPPLSRRRRGTAAPLKMRIYILKYIVQTFTPGRPWHLLRHTGPVVGHPRKVLPRSTAARRPQFDTFALPRRETSTHGLVHLMLQAPSRPLELR